MFSGGGSSMEDTKQKAYVKILEQPASKALRFRYECEGRSAGSIPGVNSTPESKTFPSIQIVGYKGRAVVVVSCVTKDPPYRPHPHNLVGKEGCKKGVCTVEITSESMAVTFSNLGIQCVKKKDIDDALKVREEIRVDPFRTGFSHRSQPTSIDLNAVRLCFQVFLEGSERGKFTFQLAPVVSDPIFDKKAMSDLVICKLSECSATVAGGKEIILLCEKVAKEDIQVRFYEEQNGVIVWEGYGDFQPTHVHKQVAISFRAPRYRSIEVNNPVKVNIQLRRPSDGATSESLPFEFVPIDSGRPAFWSLRKALGKKGNYSMFSNILASNTALLTGGPQRAAQVSWGPSTTKVIAHLPDDGSSLQSKDISIVLGGENKTGIVHDGKDENENNTAEVVMLDDDMLEDNEVKVESAKDSKHVYDYAEVQKWKGSDEKNENTRDEIVESVELKNEANLKSTANNNEDAAETCRSLNELLSQVAELDEIYSDTRARLFGAGIVSNTESGLSPIQDENQSPPVIEMVDVEDLYDDSQTYSSLQLAMKNPIELLDITAGRYEDVVPQSHGQSPLISIAAVDSVSTPSSMNNKREMSQSAASITPETSDSKLPPLPPKRIRKSPPTPPARPDHLLLHDTPQVVAPNKTLPSPPESGATNPKQSKPSLFQKLFSKKPGKSGSKKESSNTPRGSVSRQGSIGNVSLSGSVQQSGDIIIPLTGPEPGQAELTEAEHYALYTDMAPHATVSEFDEMSFYYSPVEGGNIVSQSETNLSRMSASNRDIFT